MEWQNNIQRALATGSTHQFITAITTVPVTWAGTPATADRNWCADQAVTYLDSKAGVWGQLLIHHTSPAVRETGLALLERTLSAPDLLTTCHALSGDPQWSLREMVAAAAGTILAGNPVATPIIEQWIRNQDPYLVRAGVVAVKVAVHRHYSVSDAIPLLEPALPIRHSYVRKNLGPYTIGDGLLRVDAQPTLSWLHDVSTCSCPVTLWNTAAVFTAAAARSYIDHAHVILTRLAADPRTYVRRAVVSACRRLAHTHKQQVINWATAWETDPLRRTTGQQITTILT